MKFLETHHLDTEERKEYEDKGLFCYDLRNSDDGVETATIEKSVLVNRCGSMITNEEIPLGDKFPDSCKDYEEFINENEVVSTIEELLGEEQLKFYDKNEIKQILKSKERLVYVDNGIDEVVIKYKDIPDFIVDVNERLGMSDLKVFDFHNPTSTPLLSTYGEFLNQCDPKVREDIIDRLVKLQTGAEKCREYKVIDEDILEETKEEMKQEKQAKNKNKER